MPPLRASTADAATLHRRRRRPAHRAAGILLTLAVALATLASLPGGRGPAVQAGSAGPLVRAVNAGGHAVGGYQADSGFAGGHAAGTTAAIRTDRVTAPAPQAVYQSGRYGAEFRYTFGRLTPGAPYVLRLDFAEFYWTAARQRLFDVDANGQHLLRGFDIIAAAGGPDAAVAERFGVRADARGTVTVSFRSVVQNAKVDGLALSAMPAHTPAPTSRPSPAARACPPTGPDAGCTGVPSGTPLSVHEGDLTVSTPGATVADLDIHGFLHVTAPNVVVRNVIVRGRPTTVHTALIISIAANVTIEDSEVAPSYPTVLIDGINGYGYTALRLNIHDTVDTAFVNGSNTTISDSWLHNNRHYAVDPIQHGGPSHDDGVQVRVGNNIHITGNRITGGFNSSLQIAQDGGPITDLDVSDNWVGYGGCTVNVSDKSFGPVRGLVIDGNRFAHNSRVPGCDAIMSPATGALVHAVGNIIAATGQPANIRRNGA